MDTVNLDQLADELLQKAHSSGSGRASRTVHGGRDAVMRQTLIAIAGGHGLGTHDSPGEATLQVLAGAVRLVLTGAQPWDGSAGDLVVIPPERHSLDALEDSVVLLSAVPREALD